MSAKSMLILAIAIIATVVAIEANSSGGTMIGIAAALGVVAMTAEGVLEKNNRVRFKTKLDHIGHIMIECQRGAERVETGLRGLPSLVNSGLMRKPKKFHVDPLQRAVEIDRFRIECTEAGARQLEDVLNSRYAPVVRDAGENVIEIKENPAASTGFDIRFMEVRAGSPVEVKGHLSQEILDVLQDRSRCDLLQPDIILRISPPCLVMRRKTSSGTEERIPELPDVPYLRVTPVHLQRVFNHPTIRRGPAAEIPKNRTTASKPPSEIREIRLSKNPCHNLHLWLECLTNVEGEMEGKAFTHHNIADLQHRGVFRDDLDVALAFDQRTLSILHKPTNHEETIAVDLSATDADLAQASRMLTEALKSSSAGLATLALARSQEKRELAPIQTARAPLLPDNNPAVSDVVTRTLLSASDLLSSGPGCPHYVVPHQETLRPARTANDSSEKSSEPALNSAVLASFQEIDPTRVNLEIFRKLELWLRRPAQDVRLSLACVFENRRFEILSESHPEVASVMELRLAEFSGFYLSHINENKILLVYACNGRHVEFGPERCELQPAVAAEPASFKCSALLGLAQNQSGDFIFIVSPPFKEWVRAREMLYLDARVRFATVNEIAAASKKFSLMWPEPTDQAP